MGDTRKRGPAYTRRQKGRVKPSRPKSSTKQRPKKKTRAAFPPAPVAAPRSPAPHDPGPQRWRTVIGFVVGALVGVLVVGAVWAAVSSHGNDAVRVAGDESATDVAATSGPAPTPTSDPTTAASPTALDSCRQVDAGLRDALHAAAPALGQWEVHVGAMNKLVAGAITLRQANAFWNNTRVEARRNLTAFRAAYRRALHPGAECRRPMAPMPGMSQAPRLRSCARRVQADRQVLRAADTAITTWGHHVVDMNMLRMGTMTPATANQMWLASWQEGVRQIRAYHQVARGARAVGRC